MTEAPLTPAEKRKAAAIARAIFLDEARRLSVVEVAAIIGADPRTVDRMRDKGELSFRKIGGRWSISRDALDRDLDNL